MLYNCGIKNYNLQFIVSCFCFSFVMYSSVDLIIYVQDPDLRPRGDYSMISVTKKLMVM